MRDLNDKVTNGTLTADEWNDVPSELQNIIVAFGQTLSAGDLDQLGKGIAAYVGSGDFYPETGAADAYVCNPGGGKQGPPALNAAADGLTVRFRPANANTGASTLNLNGIGAIAIVREDLTALQAGDLLTTQDAIVRYRNAGNHFILLNYSLPPAVNVPRGYIDGFQTRRDPVDVDHDIEFGIGTCRDSGNVATITRSAVITKQIDANWAAGDNAGGFPSILTLMADTWYHLFVIRNPTSGAVDAGFDTSLTATNLLADATGFTQFRRIGSVRTDGSSNLIAYDQDGEVFNWSEGFQDVATTAPGTSEVTHALDYVPPDVKVGALVTVIVRRLNGESFLTGRIGHGDSDLTTTAPSLSNYDFATAGDMRNAQVHAELKTSTAAEIKTRVDSSSGTTELDIQVHGWRDRRGAQ